MRNHSTGLPPHNGKGRTTLTVRDPRLNSLLGGGIDTMGIEETNRIGNGVMRWVDDWARRTRGVTQYRFREDKPNSLGRTGGVR